MYMPRLDLAIVAFVLLVAVFVVIPFTGRQSIAAGQSTAAGQTDLGLQRRQVRALERIATEMAGANRIARRCR